MDDAAFFGPGAKPPREEPQAVGSVSMAPQSALDVAREAIAHNETGHIALRGGDPYGAVGPAVRRKSGFVDNALGRYQIMRSNLAKWTEEALGAPLTEREFLASPEAQDAVFNHRFGNYLMKYSPEDAASMWFSGKPLEQARGRSDGHWTAEQYVRNFAKGTQGGVQGAVSEAPEGFDMFGPGVKVQVPEAESQAVPSAPEPRRTMLPPVESGPKAEWGWPQAALYGLSAGFSPQIASAFGADPNAMRKARSAYMVDNPLGEMSGEMLGSLAPAMAGGGLGLAALRTAGRLAPAIAPATRFLGGYAGEGMKGLGGGAIRTLSNVAHGATQGALQAAATSPLGQGSLGEQVGWGAAIGGPTGGLLNHFFGRPISAATRAGVTPEKLALFEAAKQRGIPMYAGQLTENPLIKSIPVAEEHLEGQVEAFNKALVRGAGEQGGRFTDATREAARQARGQDIENIVSKYDIQMSPKLKQNLGQIWQDVKDAALGVDPLDDEEVIAIGKVLHKLKGRLETPGGLTGKQFQKAIKTGGLIHKLQVSKNLSHYGSRVKKALNEAFEDAIPAGHPDRGALAEAKQRYALLKQIEGPVAKASPEMVSPKAIHGASITKGKPIPQELKTLGDIGKYLPGVTTMGQLKGHGMPHWRLTQALGPLGLIGAGGAGAIAAHEYLKPLFDSLPQEHKNKAYTTALLVATMLGGKALGKNLLQMPGVNERVVRGTVPTLPFSVNPFITGFSPAQIGTRDDQ